MKKTLAILLSAVMMLGLLAGCGSKDHGAALVPPALRTRDDRRAERGRVLL